MAWSPHWVGGGGRNISSKIDTFLDLEEVPRWAKDSNASSVMSPKSPRKRVTISPVPAFSAAAKTLSARTLHLPRSHRRSTLTVGASHNATHANPAGH